MASWKEIERYRKSPDAVHQLAGILLEYCRDDALTDWEISFLEGMQRWEGELTTRQSEMLLVIRDSLIWVEGFSVSLLLRQCYVQICRQAFALCSGAAHHY